MSHFILIERAACVGAERAELGGESKQRGREGGPGATDSAAETREKTKRQCLTLLVIREGGVIM